jgi:mRNA-degrading endonuclease YafQ of YafQ-DinJ toxin-antitoxin module
VFKIIATEYFLRRSRKFLQKHPELRPRYEQIIADLRQDPFAPHLDYHPLSGKLKGMQAVSMTDSCRITLTIAFTQKEVILLDVGSHDEVYR